VSSFDVRVFAIRRRPGGRVFEVRWRVAGGDKSRSKPHELRGLKHRPAGTVRIVPIPPILVSLLRQHIRESGTASDGRLFRSTRGGPLSESVYGRVWHAARQAALGPAQAATPLARRPYDLPAPRGAPSYSRHSREEPGRRFLGLMADLMSRD
jgi:integrase